jgi:hypothetical protein
MESGIISHFLPKGLLEHFSIIHVFELCDLKDKQHYFEIVLEENNKILKEVDATLYESKGFTEITIQDFPIRGKAVYLKIKRRRWRLKDNPNIIIRNDFSFVAEGSGFTQELSDFLKGTGRYED